MEEEVEEEVEQEVEEEEEEEENEEEDEEELGNQALVVFDDFAIQNGALKEMSQEEELDNKPFEKLLESFGKDQLITLIKKAELVDADPAHRKIFVHGLSWDTTAETLTVEFSKYEEIKECKAITDRHRSGTRRALKQPQKKIRNRTTSCQLASQGSVPAPPPTTSSVSEYTQRKIFVSNVSADLKPEKLLEFFQQYREIKKGLLGLDKHKGKAKGFALFVYKSTESAKKALEEPHKNFEGHVLHCQKAIDRPEQSKGGYGGGASGEHHQQYQQHQQGQHQVQSHYHHAKKGKYSSSGSETGHLMAPSGPNAVGFNLGIDTAGFNPGVATAASTLNPSLGQALTALLATQAIGLGLGNLLGGLGGTPMNQGAPAEAMGIRLQEAVKTRLGCRVVIKTHKWGRVVPVGVNLVAVHLTWNIRYNGYVVLTAAFMLNVFLKLVARLLPTSNPLPQFPPMYFSHWLRTFSLEMGTKGVASVFSVNVFVKYFHHR
ncbi:hypothetical protein DITRI_Ditri14bG0080500 [Diplodiscus trichospermus]